MSEMLDLYINVLLRVTGKNLEKEFETVNIELERYNELLRGCRIEEKKENGKVFKFWVEKIDEFKHELLSKSVLICSRRVRIEVRDPYPHGDNRMNYLRAKIHTALMQIKTESYHKEGEKIVIETRSTHVPGNSMKEGRWPKDRLDGAFR